MPPNNSTKEANMSVTTSKFIFDGLKGVESRKTHGKFDRTLKILEHVGKISPDKSDSELPQISSLRNSMSKLGHREPEDIEIG